MHDVPQISEATGLLRSKNGMSKELSDSDLQVTSESIPVLVNKCYWESPKKSGEKCQK